MLKKYEGNPILSPNGANPWESLATLNPGAWYEDGTFYLLYRAAGHDAEHRIHLGLATSRDGMHFERCFNHPVLSPLEESFDGGCVEDARVVKFGDEFYVTYAYRPFPPGQYWTFPADSVRTYDAGPDAPAVLINNETNTGLLKSRDLKSFRRLGRLTRADLDDRDVILFPERVNGKFALLHRPRQWAGEGFGTDCPSMWINFSDDMLVWDWNRSVLLAKPEYWWEAKKLGGGTPPLRTAQGWLEIYHGVDEAGVYRVGAMMLDADDPTRILARTPEPIMQPEHEYETTGFYAQCVFPTGNVVVDGTLYVYYGSGDKYCNLATCALDELVAHVMRYPV